MKRLLTIMLAVCLCVTCAMAQSRLERGQAAFNKGNYSEAVTQWEAAAVVDKSLAGKAGNLIENAKKCDALRRSAESSLRAGNHDQAEAAYRQLKTLNAKDPAIASGLARCKQGKAVIAKEAEAGRYWASIKDSWNREAYEKYLSSYPNNKNASDARNMIVKLDDKQAWEIAKSSHTEEAYRKYLATSKLALFKNDAQKALEQLEEEDIWAQVKAVNTVAAYEEYCKTHSLFAAEAEAAIERIKQEECVARAEQYQQKGSYYLARKELKSALEMGTMEPATMKRYRLVDEAVLYHECMNNRRYHSSGKDDCERYLAEFCGTDNSKCTSVRKQLKRHTKLYGKDYDEYLNLGISALDLGGGGGMMYLGPRVAFTLGSWDFPVAFTVSVGAYYHMGLEPLDEDKKYEFSCWQTPLQARLKINLFGNDKLKCYLAGGASYNMNFAVKNMNEHNDEKISDNIIHRFNSSAFGEIGICGKHYELAFFYSKDLQPLFKKETAVEKYGDSKIFDVKQRFGISWAYYFNLR